MLPVRIQWYDGLENYMSVAESESPVLAHFFTVKAWDFVRNIYGALLAEEDCHLETGGFEFAGSDVLIYDQSGEIRVDRFDFYESIGFLFDVLIVGANEEHHSVRYEPWWHEFTETFFQLQERCKIESVHREEAIVTLTIAG